MPLRRGKPLRFQPTTVCDALDGTNGPSGAMQVLTNLIPDPATDKVWVPRPGAQKVFNGTGIMNPAIPTGLLVVGNTAYGTIPSARNPGYDEPFAVNLLTGALITVNGINAGNVPASPPIIGDWTPPILAQVAGRVIVTHPGFPGGAIKFGWFDVSGFSVSTPGNTTNGSAVLTGNPAILEIQPGMEIAGVGIPVPNTVISTAAFVLDTTVTSNSNATLNGIASTAGIAVGQAVSENPTLGIASGTTVASVVGAHSVTITPNATASATGAVTFNGATITMANNATASNSQETIVVSAGSTLSPLWGAGDTNINNLPSVPVGIAQFNGRAYYALGLNGIVYSDSGIPCQVSNNAVVQALTTDDGLAVTAIGPLMEYSALTGGIVQGIIAFEGASKMQQITGDQTTNNLSMNALPVATGTLAPLSVQPCELGLAFLSPQGLRIVDFSGRISPPIGDAGKGITVPFIYAINPSRMALAANADVIRMTVKNGQVEGQPNQEWWFDITRKVWSGPHTFPAALIQPWGDTFLLVGAGIPAALWQSDPQPNLESSFTENGVAMTWVFQTSLQPDNGELAMNSLVDMTIALALAPEPTVITAYDENDSIITGEGGTLSAQITLASVGIFSLWGSFKWGEAPWYGPNSPLQQRSIDWPFPPVFKQMSIGITSASSNFQRVGNLYMRYQILSYRLQEPLVA